MQLDPSQWTVADQPLLRYTVRTATEVDIVQRAVAAGVAGASAGVARPDIWQQPSRDGLSLRDTRWATALAAPATGRPGGGGRRRSRDDSDEERPAWMRAVRPRLLPAARAAARREEQQHRQQAQPQRQDTATSRSPQQPQGRDWWAALDEVRAPRADGRRPTPPPWEPIWRWLHGALAPREHRFVAWRLLHGVLPGCGAAMAVATRRGDLGAAMSGGGRTPGSGGDIRSAGDCHRPACAAAQCLEGIAHAMLECPVAATVWQWVADVWAAAAPGGGSGGGGAAGPPRTAAVLLLGDRRAWDPGGPHMRDRWDALRLAALFYLSRCLGAARAAPSAAHRVIAQIVAFLRERIRQDYTRASCSPAAIAISNPTWLPADRRDTLPFAQRWLAGGALCVIEDGQLRVLLSTSHPVFVPPLPG